MNLVDASDATPSTTAALGGVHFRVTNPDASAFAIKAGALAEGESLICLRAMFTPSVADGATPVAGDAVALPDDDGVVVLFTVAMVHVSLPAPGAYDPARDAVGYCTLQPGEVLLVQLINAPEAATSTHLTES